MTDIDIDSHCLPHWVGIHRFSASKDDVFRWPCIFDMWITVKDYEKCKTRYTQKWNKADRRRVTRRTCRGNRSNATKVDASRWPKCKQIQVGSIQKNLRICCVSQVIVTQLCVNISPIDEICHSDLPQQFTLFPLSREHSSFSWLCYTEWITNPQRCPKVGFTEPPNVVIFFRSDSDIVQWLDCCESSVL